MHNALNRKTGQPKSRTLVRQTITDTLIDELREEIRAGRLAPGSRLRQLEIAERFGVSSTPVREAFSALEREGLLVSSPHKGVIVFRPTAADLRETYDIRIPLEALATEKAVVNMTAEDFAALDQLLEQMAASTDRPARYSELNRSFHSRIYEAARSPKLLRVVTDLRDASTAYLRLYENVAPTAEQTQHEHELIAERCKAGDPAGAGAAVESHLRHTVERVSTQLPEDEAREGREPI